MGEPVLAAEATHVSSMFISEQPGPHARRIRRHAAEWHDGMGVG